jgi:hypothetical protein
MLHSKIIAICLEIRIGQINTLCGEEGEFLNVKTGGTYSDHWDLKGY